MTESQLEEQFKRLGGQLISAQNKNGFWTGRLSSSALSTAVAIVAIKKDDPASPLIEKGLNWLYKFVNKDGGYGDTPESGSNISTSLLSYAAIYFCGKESLGGRKVLHGLEKYLETQNISFTTETLTKAVLDFYGKDLTFSVPILTMLAICGISGEKAFKYIPSLPFEFSLLPTRFYRFFKLQVVSYAIPALIAVGITGFKNRRKRFNPFYSLRGKAIKPSLTKLEAILPESGGFLEAAPLTAFVSMCLIYSGYNNNQVVKKGIQFLKTNQRDDGSWPIDTNLSTWVTTLSIKALLGKDKNFIYPVKKEKLRQYLLSTQYTQKHSFNDALPGGWGWTNLSGSVPDADDTSGAITALHQLFTGNENEILAITNGCNWLLKLQNSDGGFPTFSKGWGKLPFDKSSADITGHAILALAGTLDILKNNLSPKLINQYNKSLQKALNFLRKTQSTDGKWLALWFGNQKTANHTNPVYGTARVTTYLTDTIRGGIFSEKTKRQISTMIQLAQQFLLEQQNNDFSWGAQKGIPGTIEETSLALSALAGSGNNTNCYKGFDWLYSNSKNELKPYPIGLYFASLWYSEKLYPLIFYIDALQRFIKK